MGSEMCIRDSGSTNTFVQQFTPPITKTENSQIGTPCSVLVAADAVADAVAVAVAAAVAVAVTVVMSTIHETVNFYLGESRDFRKCGPLDASLRWGKRLAHISIETGDRTVGEGPTMSTRIGFTKGNKLEKMVK